MAKHVGAQTLKLAQKLGSRELAEKLVAAGFHNPRQIRDAADKDLEAVPGIGKASREQIRSKIPRI